MEVYRCDQTDQTLTKAGCLGVLGQVFDAFEVFGKVRVVCELVVFVERRESD